MRLSIMQLKSFIVALIPLERLISSAQGVSLKRNGAEVECDRPYKMWKLLREYDLDLDSEFTRVYSPNLISGFDRYHRHPDPDAHNSHNENI